MGENWNNFVKYIRLNLSKNVVTISKNIGSLLITITTILITVGVATVNGQPANLGIAEGMTLGAIEQFLIVLIGCIFGKKEEQKK